MDWVRSEGVLGRAGFRMCGGPWAPRLCGAPWFVDWGSGAGGEQSEPYQPRGSGGRCKPSRENF